MIFDKRINPIFLFEVFLFFIIVFTILIIFRMEDPDGMVNIIMLSIEIIAFIGTAAVAHFRPNSKIYGINPPKDNL